jgi:hypothetical protein
MRQEDLPSKRSPGDIDWREIAKAAISSAFVVGIVGGALHALGKMLEIEAENTVEPSVGQVRDADTEPSNRIEQDGNDKDVIAAATVLGVAPSASETEIRTALRARLASSGLHPDHGGDGIEAAKLIAAKNLLIERLRNS